MRARDRAAEREFLSAHERFKSGHLDRLGSAVLASVVLHWALFEYSPDLRLAEITAATEEITAIELPPEVRVPPPPQQIARPATPRVSARPIREDVTIAPTTFEENPVEHLAPPPERQVNVRDAPVYIARDVEPRLRNGDEVRALLERLYPPILREAGIGGTVVLWVFVEPDGSAGTCQIHRSSGYEALDRAAERITEQMVFSPALSRDRPVGVWISQPIEFRIRSG